MKIVNKADVDTTKKNAINNIELLYNNSDLTNNEVCKRIANYYNWVKTQSKFVDEEHIYVCPIEDKLKRGTVVWVDFGFNVGNEFGGRHPAIILRKTGKTIFVVPVSSQEPDDVQDFHVKIDKVYGFKNMTRWTNVLKLQNVSIQRVDVTASIGNVKGKVLDEINKSLKKCHIF